MNIRNFTEKEELLSEKALMEKELEIKFDFFASMSHEMRTPLNGIVGMGSEVLIANNGKEAIDIFLENKDKIDVVLMDIQMPVMDGIESTKILKEEHYIKVPIIGLSANNMEGDKEKYLGLGLDGYIAKPIVGKVLKEEILKVLNSFDQE